MTNTKTTKRVDNSKIFNKYLCKTQHKHEASFTRPRDSICSCGHLRQHWLALSSNTYLKTSIKRVHSHQPINNNDSSSGPMRNKQESRKYHAIHACHVAQEKTLETDRKCVNTPYS
eukprot:TRINITY_DN3749_c0_g1_i13.p1 TRINITY_DN3749_c0_g1~~TRINITY_DN3749_c0_g1_i13.p1  ORF type:complete len:116 (+),score=15.31 TRINITY_DN3749_c0_g1_i13:884-1231(+)